MNVNLTHFGEELDFNRKMVERVTTERGRGKIVGPPALVPTTDVPTVYEVWWPTESGQWAWVTPDGLTAYVDHLPEANDMNETNHR